MRRKTKVTKPAVRRRLVEAVASYAYDEYRLGREGHRVTFDSSALLPMWHELSPDDQGRHENRARMMLEIHGLLPPKAQSRAKTRSKADV